MKVRTTELEYCDLECPVCKDEGTDQELQVSRVRDVLLGVCVAHDPPILFWAGELSLEYDIETIEQVLPEFSKVH